MYKVCIGYLLIIALLCSEQPIIQELNIIDRFNQPESIFKEGKLDSDFSDEIYIEKFCCQTRLYILELKHKQEDKIANQRFKLSYKATQTPTIQNIKISVQQEGTPCPQVQTITNQNILLLTNCPQQPSSDNYWSKVDITIFEQRFSFRLQCDSGGRHGNFQWGYVIIMVINSIIMTGVALHSRIWSIRFKNKALGIPVRWIWLTVFSVFVVGIGAIVMYIDSKSKKAYLFTYVIMILGDGIAMILGVIILDQIFFLYDRFKIVVWKFFRICDILSILVSMIIVSLFGIVPTIASNYPFNDVLSVIISVGSIKLFKFLNLKDALVCCFVVFAFENLTALLIFVFYNQISYNDLFGASVSSPLVMQISILSYSLYQKCSWLPVTQIILPGITIAYLRRYDYSRDSKLYFILGNLLFVLSTFLWILIQSLTVHSLPFALITYPALFIPIMILAYKRDELKILMNGKFYDPQFMDSSQVRNTRISGNDESHLQQNTLQGLIPDSDDLQKSGRSD